MSKDIILKADGVHKSYLSKSADRKKLEVLKNLEISIPKGSISSVIGSSGSGKSTLLHILGGLDTPDQGSVYWNNELISEFNNDQIAETRNEFLGFVFQFHHLLPEFTALENVAMPSLIKGSSMEEAQERAHHLLKQFGVGERFEHKPTQLSGGEQQRVSMARALMNKPQIILADEPTGNLDDKNTAIILDMLFELREKEDISILLITHEMDIAKRSDVVYELKNGVLTQ